MREITVYIVRYNGDRDGPCQHIRVESKDVEGASYNAREALRNQIVEITSVERDMIIGRVYVEGE